MNRPKALPDKHHRIPDSAVDPGRYTETLLQAAYEAGVYDESTAMTVRGRLFELLAARLAHFTNGESCSVPAETAQAVLSAVLYTVDLRLLTEPDPDAAAACLADVSPTQLFEAGLTLIKRRLRASELLWRKHLPLFERLPDSVMRTTAVSGIAGFFRAYQPEGLSDRIPITADYPLYCGMNDIRHLRGVSFLARYLQGLCDEVRFLSKFRTDTVHAVLSAADCLYRETPSNLFAPLFATVIGMTLLGRPFSAWKYGLNGADVDAIEALYDSGAFTLSSVRTAAARVCDLLMLDGTTAAYISEAAAVFYKSASDCLARRMPLLAFPCTDAAYRSARYVYDPSAEDKAFFRMACGAGELSYRGGRMTADAFRCLDFDLRACTDAAEKTALILSRVTGLEDIADLLTADTAALDGREKAHLYASLPAEARQVLEEMIGEG